MQSLRENYVFRFTVCTIWDQRTTLGAKTPCIGPFLVKVFMSLYARLDALQMLILPNTAVKLLRQKFFSLYW